MASNGIFSFCHIAKDDIFKVGRSSIGMPHVIVITGLSATGKTETSDYLSKELGYQVFGVGSFRDKIAKQRGFASALAYDKVHGPGKLYAELYPQMISEVERLATKGVIVEGVRSIAFLEEIKHRVGKENMEIFNLAIPKSKRLKFFMTREGIKSKSVAKRLLARRDMAKIEVGLFEVLKHTKQHALRHDGDLPALFQKVKSRLGRRP